MHSVSNQTAPTDNQQGRSIEALMVDITKLPSQEFQSAFRRMRCMYPEDVARSCIAFLAENPDSEIGRPIFSLLCNTEHYLPPLLDPYFLPLDSAKPLIQRFRE